MTTYSERNPPRGRDVVRANVAGAPIRQVTADYTPLPLDPPDDPEVLARLVYKQLGRLLTASPTRHEQEEALEMLRNKISRGQKTWTAIAGVVAVVASIFGAGVSFVGVRDELATDDEIRGAIVEHNEADPSVRNPETGAPLGAHPALRSRIETAAHRLDGHDTSISELHHKQGLVDMRGEYQFEFSRWQAQIAECQRTRKCPPPPKPARLVELERDLMLGYTDR